MMALMKKGTKVLPSGSGRSEATRSPVFPLSLLSPAVSRRVAARLFSETLGALRAGSYQAGGEAAFALLDAIDCRFEGELARIWSLWERGARKGI